MSFATSVFVSLATAGLMATAPAAQAGAPGEGAVAFSQFYAAAAPAAASASSVAVQPAPVGPAHDMAQLIAGGIALVSVGAATVATLRQSRRERAGSAPAPAAGE